MRVLITGVTGQAGGILARQLIAAGHEVHGMARWTSDRAKVAALLRMHRTLRIVSGDLTDLASLVTVLETVRPEVVYNLGALASSGQSWAQPLAMTQINAVGPLHMLEAIRTVDPKIRMVQASTSEQYGRLNEQPQNERTPFGSMNVYGIAKTFAHQACVNYRDSYGMHVSTALMHNYVSLDRNPYFVDRKITQGVAAIALGYQMELRLGNCDARRDWGWAEDYMQAWPLIAAHPEPGDYVLATGQSHSVWAFVMAACDAAGIDDSAIVRNAPEFMRPTDVAELRGDPSYIEKVLGWRAIVGFNEIVYRMVRHDLDLTAARAHA
jgi:GDPmannose 4,6-dehydratase